MRLQSIWRGAWRPAAFVAIVASLASVVLPLATPAEAHFKLNVNIRVFHVVHEPQQLRILARLPMAYLVADKAGAETADGTRVPAPYTTNRLEDGVLLHYLDPAAVRGDPAGLARILAEGLVLEVGGEILRAEPGRLRAYPATEQPPFALLGEAEAALAGPVYDASFAATYVGDTIVDVELVYPHPGQATTYSLRSLLDPGLLGQADTANLILDHASDPPLIFRVRGLLSEPANVSHSALSAAWTFIKEGVRHIFGGTDHVLFVLCLALGAASIGALAWRITGFTLGHTVTLSLGFFGYAPQGAWFVPLVETGIALSIAYAAITALVVSRQAPTTLITAALGLLHGLGFSFVLREILQLDSPNLWQSLLAFNVGVEIGQLLIALVVWMILAIIVRRMPQRLKLVRWIVALPCIFVAMIWTGERGAQLIFNL